MIAPVHAETLAHTAGLIGGTLAIGSVVGFLSGLLGKGGSAVTTPALQIFLNVPDFLALASPLPATLPTLLSAAWAYRGKDLVDWRVVRLTIYWGVPATLAGSFLSEVVGGHWCMILTGLMVLALGVSLAFGGGESKPATHVSSAWAIALIGVFVGALSGLLANTGGILYGPLFIRALGMPPKRALACSLIVSAALAVPGMAAHMYLGHVDWWIVAALSVAAIPSSYVGARVALSLHDRHLVRIYGALLIAFGAYDLWHLYLVYNR